MAQQPAAAAQRCVRQTPSLLREAPLHPAHREATLKTRVLPHADPSRRGALRRAGSPVRGGRTELPCRCSRHGAPRSHRASSFGRHGSHYASGRQDAYTCARCRQRPGHHLYWCGAHGVAHDARQPGAGVAGGLLPAHLAHPVPPPAVRGPVAPSNNYDAPLPFTTNQCPPIYEGADLPEEQPLQPDGREVTCNCDDGVLGGTCVACDGGTLAEYLGDELEAAVEDSGDVKSCAGGVTVRPSLPVTAHRCACCCCACCC